MWHVQICHIIQIILTSYKSLLLFHTAVLCVWIRTFFMLPFLERVGECPLNPGFWMPIPSGLGLGFLRLDLSGLLVTDPEVEPFEEVVVVIEARLPFAAVWRLLPGEWTYGLPLASVMEIPPGLLTRRSRKPGLLKVVASSPVGSRPCGIVGSPPCRRENMTSYRAIMKRRKLRTMDTTCHKCQYNKISFSHTSQFCANSHGCKPQLKWQILLHTNTNCLFLTYCKMWRSNLHSSPVENQTCLFLLHNYEKWSKSFLKILKQSKISRDHKDDIKQVPYWGPKNIGCHHINFWYMGDLVYEVCATLCYSTNCEMKSFFIFVYLLTLQNVYTYPLKSTYIRDVAEVMCILFNKTKWFLWIGGF